MNFLGIEQKSHDHGILLALPKLPSSPTAKRRIARQLAQHERSIENPDHQDLARRLEMIANPAASPSYFADEKPSPLPPSVEKMIRLTQEILKILARNGFFRLNELNKNQSLRSVLYNELVERELRSGLIDIIENVFTNIFKQIGINMSGAYPQLSTEEFFKRIESVCESLPEEERANRTKRVMIAFRLLNQDPSSPLLLASPHAIFAKITEASPSPFFKALSESSFCPPSTSARTVELHFADALFDQIIANAGVLSTEQVEAWMTCLVALCQGDRLTEKNWDLLTDISDFQRFKENLDEFQLYRGLPIQELASFGWKPPAQQKETAIPGLQALPVFTKTFDFWLFLFNQYIETHQDLIHTIETNVSFLEAPKSKRGRKMALSNNHPFRPLLQMIYATLKNASIKGRQKKIERLVEQKNSLSDDPESLFLLNLLWKEQIERLNRQLETIAINVTAHQADLENKADLTLDEIQDAFLRERPKARLYSEENANQAQAFSLSTKLAKKNLEELSQHIQSLICFNNLLLAKLSPVALFPPAPSIPCEYKETSPRSQKKKVPRRVKYHQLVIPDLMEQHTVLPFFHENKISPSIKKRSTNDPSCSEIGKQTLQLQLSQDLEIFQENSLSFPNASLIQTLSPGIATLIEAEESSSSPSSPWQNIRKEVNDHLILMAQDLELFADLIRQKRYTLLPVTVHHFLVDLGVSLEQALRLSLLAQGRQVPKIHNLKLLLADSCSTLTKDQIAWIKECNQLLIWGRYPSSSERFFGSVEACPSLLADLLKLSNPTTNNLQTTVSHLFTAFRNCFSIALSSDAQKNHAYIGMLETLSQLEKKLLDSISSSPQLTSVLQKSDNQHVIAQLQADIKKTIARCSSLEQLSFDDPTVHLEELRYYVSWQAEGEEIQSLYGDVPALAFWHERNRLDVEKCFKHLFEAMCIFQEHEPLYCHSFEPFYEVLGSLESVDNDLLKFINRKISHHYFNQYSSPDDGFLKLFQASKAQLHGFVTSDKRLKPLFNYSRILQVLLKKWNKVKEMMQISGKTPSKQS